MRKLRTVKMQCAGSTCKTPAFFFLGNALLLRGRLVQEKFYSQESYIPGNLIPRSHIPRKIRWPCLVIIRFPRNLQCLALQLPCNTFSSNAPTLKSPGAEVLVECKDRTTSEVVYTKKGVTDSTGTYKIFVNEDHADQICNAKLLSSPQNDCNVATPGRDEARVILTRNNGIASDQRFANSLGYMKNEVQSGCAEILRQYQMFDEEN